MDIAIAPAVSDDEHEECAICGTEQPYVLYEGDKMCRDCGHVPNQIRVEAEDEDAWDEWHRHRSEEYSGWTGEDRIKFPGGFVAAYVFEEDFN